VVLKLDRAIIVLGDVATLADIERLKQATRNNRAAE
jgi:hypothetical protein